jgi:acetylglutamate kinase
LGRTGGIERDIEPTGPLKGEFLMMMPCAPFSQKNSNMTLTENITESNTNSPFGGPGDVYVVKIGGNIIDDETKLSAFLQSFAAVKRKKILVHGGGKLATKLADQMGVKQQMIDGRRITDVETLKIVTMVYAGYINKNIVAQLQSHGCNAMGLTGADGNLVKAHKRVHPTIDYGYVGDVDAVNAGLLQSLLEQDIAVVAAPITSDGNGHLLNTNADTIAQEIATALGKIFSVSLIYSFEKSGVLLDVNDENSVISKLTPAYYAELKTAERIFAGMLPKLDNAFAALQKGVNKVIIGKAEQLHQLITGEAGTTILYE